MPNVADQDGDHALPRPARSVVMGVLNVTPDSFSDGGKYVTETDAIAHARAMWADGADIVDVGGESTRPGASRVDAEVELSRVLPVIRTLAPEDVWLSVDTMRASVAATAISAGARMINDVSGGLADPDMARVAAETGVPWVISHWRGQSREMNSLATYRDVLAEVRDELSSRVDVALAAGVKPESIVLDPGLGFAKRAEHNWTLLRNLDSLSELGFPLLIGASRKRFLTQLATAATNAATETAATQSDRPDQPGRPDDQLDNLTAAVSALAARAGVWGVRVHQVRPSRDAVLVANAWSGRIG